MTSFYYPKTVRIQNLPIIIYPMIGTEAVFDRTATDSLEKHVEEVLQKCGDFLHDAMYVIVIVWFDNNQRMTDVWKFGPMESWQAGPVVDVKNFKNLEVVTDMGISAGDGLVMLGREEEHRRNCADFESFITTRPTLPAGIQPEEEFYV